MIEESPNNLDGGPSQSERAENQSLEQRRRMMMSELKALMDEGLRLVADDNASLDRLFEINRQERVLIDQLGEIERDFAAEQGTK